MSSFLLYGSFLETNILLTSMPSILKNHLFFIKIAVIYTLLKEKVKKNQKQKQQHKKHVWFFHNNLYIL